MSSGLSNGIRVLRGCKALLSQSKPSATVPAAAAAKSKTAAKPKENSARSSGTAAAAAPKPKVKRVMTQPIGLMKPMRVSPALGNFLGASEASRNDAVKKVWSYIKLRNLQNPANKREIYCDYRLKTIFQGKEKVGFLEVTKLLSPHFVKN